MVKVLNSRAGMVIAIGVVGAVALYFAEKKIRDGIAVVGQSINPTSQENIFYTSVNGLGATISGNDNFNLGSWIYDVVNGSAAEQAERKKEQDFINKIYGNYDG
jgi:Mn2+/Fe2+ NRAMP family transporter